MEVEVDMGDVVAMEGMLNIIHVDMYIMAEGEGEEEGMEGMEEMEKIQEIMVRFQIAVEEVEEDMEMMDVMVEVEMVAEEGDIAEDMEEEEMDGKMGMMDVVLSGTIQCIRKKESQMSDCIIIKREVYTKLPPRPSALKTESFTSNTNWTVPNDLDTSKPISVRLFGGGGGGCGMYDPSNSRYPPGGGGGGWMNNAEINNITPNQVIQITIGSGGRANNTSTNKGSARANSGGTTSFGIYLSANGGDGAYCIGGIGYGGNGGAGGYGLNYGGRGYQFGSGSCFNGDARDAGIWGGVRGTGALFGGEYLPSDV